MQTQTAFELPARLSAALALLFAMSSAAGIFWPSVYAREAPLWAAQGAGQDWVDLLFVAPGLALLSWRTLTGSRLAALLLAGVLAYTEYSLLIYTLALHFNPIFLLLCAELGLSTFALAAAALVLARTDVRAWFAPPCPTRSTAAWLICCSVVFALLWLAEVVPATLAGAVPKTIVESGLIANPVHVLDLSIALPAMLLAGVALLQDRALGYRLAPPILVFVTLMCLAIGGMMVTMVTRGLSQNTMMVGVFGVTTLVGGVIAALFLRRLSPGTQRPAAAVRSAGDGR